MKKISKALLLTIALIFTISNLTMASSIGVNVNGTNKGLITEAKDARTYVGTDSLKEFGLTTQVKSNSIILKNSDVTFTFTLNKNEVKVNNTVFTIDSISYKKGNRYFVPLRFVLETLNYDIGWDSVKRRVVAKRKAEITLPMTISDGNNTYTVKEKVKKIVSLAPGVTEKLFAIGAGDMIVGRTKYCTYPESASNIEDIGSLYTPNLERIVEIYPDIIIAETHFKQEILDKMNEAEIQIIATSSPSKIDEIYDFTLKLGVIVDKNYEARALVSSMKAKVGRIKYVLRDINESKKPTAYYVVGTGQYGEYTAGKGTFISEMINISGGKNVADDVEGWSYSLEKLIDKDPKIIFGGKFNMDTMVNHYSVAKKRRQMDYYTPGGVMGKRPDRATIVYSNMIRKEFKNSPIIIGGIEASLRRLAHYDYWSDKVKRSILLDSGADLLSYGMGEKSIVEIADALNSGIEVSDISFIDGTVYKAKDLSSVYLPRRIHGLIVYLLRYLCIVSLAKEGKN